MELVYSITTCQTITFLLMKLRRYKMNIKNKATYELKNMVKALSMFELLNTNEENQRLEKAKKELKIRRSNNGRCKYSI